MSDIKSEHYLDAEGNPSGGKTMARGIDITWQCGPLGQGKDRIEPNGAFVEDVISAALDRLQYYQDSKFACDENGRVISNLHDALAWLTIRTEKRKQRGVEGTHQV